MLHFSMATNAECVPESPTPHVGKVESRQNKTLPTNRFLPKNTHTYVDFPPLLPQKSLPQIPAAAITLARSADIGYPPAYRAKI